MDPDVTLAEIRELIAQDYRSELARDDVCALIERVEALDNWLKRGGFLPKVWQTRRA